jgi:signal transduction histidine kinase
MLSFRARITLWGTGIVFVALLLFTLFVYVLAAAAVQANLGPVAAQASLVAIRRLLFLSGFVALVAAAIGIWLVAGRALRPLDLVARTAEDIRVTRDLTRRLPEAPGWSDLNRLAQAFNGMLERLEEAQQRLASALAAQQRFVADASHELRTPLTSIRNNAGLLLGRSDVSAADRDAALEDIAAESERMSRLVRDLLTLARSDADQRIELAPLQFDALVEDVGRQAQQLNPTRRFDVHAQPARVKGDPDSLRRLLWILLDNAVKFTADNGCIHLSVIKNDGRVITRVADDGVGIAREHVDRIFDRFFQSDASRAGSGAGLGLAIARAIVHGHGGTVAAANNVGAPGASFTIDLPTAGC